jgi:hypothetical protein
MLFREALKKSIVSVSLAGEQRRQRSAAPERESYLTVAGGRIESLKVRFFH